MIDPAYYWTPSEDMDGSHTFYPSIAEYVQCDDATYTTAADGASPGVISSTSIRVGQLFSTPTYFVWEAFLAFDLSLIPSGATITDATLSLDFYSDNTVTDFNLLLAVYDFGAAVDTGDFRTRAQLAALTPVASDSTVGLATGGGYYAMDDSGLAAALTPGAVNRFILWSDRHEAGTSPTGEEYGYWEGVGLSSEPKLEVSWT